MGGGAAKWTRLPGLLVVQRVVHWVAGRAGLVLPSTVNVWPVVQRMSKPKPPAACRALVMTSGPEGAEAPDVARVKVVALPRNTAVT